MKKNIKKITILTTTTASTIGLITPIFVASNKLNYNTSSFLKNTSSDFNPNSKLTFNGKEYNNLKEAANDYVSKTNGNVDYKTYIGDINSAISNGNPYKTIDLTKLREKDDSKIQNAYKTLTDKYVWDLNEAKKTYIKEPIVQWTDNNGKYFDSEQEAKNSMSYNNFTTSVSFYEVNDDFRSKKNVRINPLNKEDNDELKRIAIYNSTNNNGEFSLSRLEGKINENYSFANKEGKSISEIQNITNSIIQGYVDIIKNGLWLNASVEAKSDVKELPVYTGGSNASILNTEYGTEANQENKNKEVSYSQFLNDAKYLVNLDYLKEKFDLYGVKPLFGSKEIYKDARMKKDQTIFGGQKYNFLFINAPQLIAFYSTAFGENSIGFLGDSSRVNAYFDFGINQSQFVEKMKNNEFNVDRQTKANAAVKKANDYLRAKLLEVTSNQFPTNIIDKIVESIKEKSKNLLLEKIIPDNSKVVSAAKSVSAVESGLKEIIDKKIINELNTSFTSVNSGKTLNNEINNVLSSIFQTNEDKSKNDAIYVINYNDQPLYWINKNAFSELYSTDEFKTNPLNAVKNYLNKGIKSNTSNEFVENIKSNLTNISNALENKVLNSKPSNLITWNTINETDSKKNSILQLETKQINVKDQSLNEFKSNFISQNEFSKYYVSNQDLNKALNKKESDDISYLNNKWGTFEAVYQYNKSLEKILTKNQTSPFQLKRLTENAIKDPKDIVNLFNKDKTQKTIKYAEFFDSGFKFNESLNDGSLELIFSEEKKEKIIDSTGLNKPSKVLTIKDYDGNILTSEIINSNNNEVEKEQLIENALNKLDISASNEYVFYSDNQNNKVLLKNTYNKINTLKIRGMNGKIINYGFVNYDDLYKYVLDYIKLNSNENDLGNVYPPFEKTDIDSTKIQGILNKYPNLESLNNLSVEDKFLEFGETFKIKNLNEWKKYIGNGIHFSEKNILLRNSILTKNQEEKIAIMNVTLNNGYQFSDGSNSFEQEITYVPSSVPPIEELPDENIIGGNKNSISITAAIIAPIVFLIVAEIIVLSIILINKRNNELKINELTLKRLYSRK